MRLASTYPDLERAAVDELEALMADYEPEVTVSVGVPSDWDASSPPHLSVALDGTLTRHHPVSVRGTLRITARASDTTEAKRLAQLAHGLLLGPRADHSIIHSVLPGTGLLPARDEATQAELASVTVRATARSTPITAGS